MGEVTARNGTIIIRLYLVQQKNALVFIDVTVGAPVRPWEWMFRRGISRVVDR